MLQCLHAEELFNIIFDSGTTVPVSFDQNDFVTFQEPQMPMQMKGLA